MENKNKDESQKNTIAGISLGNVLVAGVDGTIKTFKDIDEKKLAPYLGFAEAGERTLKSMEDVSSAAEKQRQHYEGVLDVLSNLKNMEQLSCEQKIDTLKQIAKLEAAYGKLGITIDETSGKLSGFDSAAVKIIHQHKQAKEKELLAQIKQLEANAAAQQDIIDNAGIGIPFTQVQFFGEEHVNKASDKRESILEKLGEKRQELFRLQKSNPDQEWITRRNQELQKREALNKEHIRALNERESADSYLALSDSEKINEKKESVKKEKLRQEELYRGGKTLHSMLLNEEDSIKQLELREKLLSLENEYIESQKKEYDAQKEIERLEQKRNEQISRLEQRKKEYLEESRFEYQYQKLIANGLEEEAQKLKLIHDAKAQGVQLSKEEVKQLLQQKQELETLQKHRKKRDGEVVLESLGKNQKNELRDKAFRSVGMSKESELNNALEEAERIKGDKLSDKERQRIEKYVNLSHRLDSRNPLDLAGMEIKSNELTARGGFLGGAAKPDPNGINQKLLATQKETNLILTQIKDFYMNN